MKEKFLIRFKTSLFIVLATVLAVLVKFLPLSIGDYLFDIFVLAIIIVASFEVATLFEKSGKTLNKFLATIYAVFNYAALLISIKNYEFKYLLLVELIALAIYAVVIYIVEMIIYKNNDSKQRLNSTLNTLLVCLYPTFGFMLMLGINHIDLFVGIEHASVMFVVLILAITMLSDTFAYLVGSLVRGPKLAPKISPNKTISGSIGGVVGGVIGAMLVYLVISVTPMFIPILSVLSLSWWHFLLMGLFGSIIGQAGDLFESFLKRKAGVSDSGNLFPGHGGMLDRIDAMTAVTAFLFIILFVILI